jgi:hypothetical protein
MCGTLRVRLLEYIFDGDRHLSEMSLVASRRKVVDD